MISLFRWWRGQWKLNRVQLVRDLSWLAPRIWLRWCRFTEEKDATSIPVLFINLDHRTDRRKAFERDYPAFGLQQAIRISGVDAEDGRVGASLAHKAALEEALKKDWKNVIICEDDIELVVDSVSLHKVISEFLACKYLDVLCIGNRVKGVLYQLTDNLALSNNIQTASMYVVKKQSMDLLRISASESVEMLKAGLPQDIAAVDAHWKTLQSGSLNFCVPYFRCVQQRPGFSDTARKYTNYGV